MRSQIGKSRCANEMAVVAATAAATAYLIERLESGLKA